MKKTKYILYIFILVFYSCSSFITDPGPQPTVIKESAYEPMLNILGVLRPDNESSINKSFVHVEKTVSVEQQFENLVVQDAEVWIYIDSNGIYNDSMQFFYTDYGNTDLQTEYRNRDFQPTSGKKYKIRCSKEGYPDLTSETVVPGRTQIADDSVKLTASLLEFKIANDANVNLYDIYLAISNHEFHVRVKKEEGQFTPVSLSFDKGDATEATLTIYAYDIKLSAYLAFNIIYKPQIYTPSYSTVENGYGCFGSLSITEKRLAFE